MRQSEGADLIEILKGRLVVKQVNIANFALTADVESADKLEMKEEAVDARFYERMIKVLRDIADGTEDLHDVAVRIEPQVIEEAKEET